MPARWWCPLGKEGDGKGGRRERGEVHFWCPLGGALFGSSFFVLFFRFFCCGSLLRGLFRGLSGVGRTSSRSSLMSGPQPLTFPEVTNNQMIISVRNPEFGVLSHSPSRQSGTNYYWLNFWVPRQGHSENSPAPGGDEPCFTHPRIQSAPPFLRLLGEPKKKRKTRTNKRTRPVETRAPAFSAGVP